MLSPRLAASPEPRHEPIQALLSLAAGSAVGVASQRSRYRFGHGRYRIPERVVGRAHGNRLRADGVQARELLSLGLGGDCGLLPTDPTGEQHPPRVLGDQEVVHPCRLAW